MNYSLIFLLIFLSLHTARANILDFTCFHPSGGETNCSAWDPSTEHSVPIFGSTLKIDHLNGLFSGPLNSYPCFCYNDDWNNVIQCSSCNVQVSANFQSGLTDFEEYVSDANSKLSGKGSVSVQCSFVAGLTGICHFLILDFVAYP